jgi:ferrochelatase
MRKKKAVVLLGFGGPTSKEEVPAFLSRLFLDPCILPYPFFMRKLLTWLIVKRKLKTSSRNYDLIGGSSPYVEETMKQGEALQKLLGEDFRVFYAMRYGAPFAEATMRDIAKFKPEDIFLLPMYPHYSLTTTRSSFLAWDECASRWGDARPTHRICCYPTHSGFVDAYADRLSKALIKHAVDRDFRILFSTHALPVSFVKRGDPYCSHVLLSFRAILGRLKEKGHSSLDARLCYQSAERGVVAWTGPSLKSEICKAAEDKKSLMVVPLSFLCEHIETLYELDIEAKEIAKNKGIERFVRIKTPSCHPLFIQGLKDIVLESARAPRSCSLDNKACWRASATLGSHL